MPISRYFLVFTFLISGIFSVVSEADSYSDCVDNVNELFANTNTDQIIINARIKKMCSGLKNSAGKNSAPSSDSTGNTISSSHSSAQHASGAAFEDQSATASQPAPARTNRVPTKSSSITSDCKRNCENEGDGISDPDAFNKCINSCDSAPNVTNTSSTSTASSDSTDSGVSSKCSDMVAKIADSCNMDKDKNIAKIKDAANQFSAGIVSNPILVCMGISEIAAGANVALDIYDQGCKSDFEECKVSCSEKANKAELEKLSGAAKTDMINKLAEKRKECSDYSKQTNPNDIAAQRAMQTMVTRNCSQLPGMGNCMSNPLSPACSMLGKVNPNDCSNPANMSNPVCAGLNGNGGAIQNLPGLGSGSTIEGNGGTSGGAAGAGIASKLGPLGLSLGGGDDPAALSDGKGQPGGVNNPGGAGGGRGGGPGGDLGGGSGKKPAAGAAGKVAGDTNIYKGMVGSSGGGYGGGSGGYRDSADKKTVAAAGMPIGPDGRLQPNFNQFRPSMKYDPGRGLAGTAGPDGITGPATDLFGKVNNQFRTQVRSLLP